MYSWNGVIEFDHNMVGQMLQNKLSEEKSLDQTIIEIDDGTGSGVVTLEFDDNGYVVQGDAPCLYRILEIMRMKQMLL